jgi:hypothetical protein
MQQAHRLTVTLARGAIRNAAAEYDIQVIQEAPRSTHLEARHGHHAHAAIFSTL